MIQGLLASYGTTAVTYATWNPADKGSNITLSGGNLIATSVSGTWHAARSTTSKASGKHYWEVVYTSGTETIIGIGNASATVTSYLGFDINGWGYFSNGKKINNNTQVAYGATYAAGDRIGVALDVTGGTIEFFKNNVSQGVAYTGLSGTLFAMMSIENTVTTANFGATALTYTPPSGYNAGLYS